MKIPALFHGRSCKFTDPQYLGIAGDPNINLSDYPFVSSFLEAMEKAVTENISDLCPTPEAWAAWLKLQGRIDADVGFFTTVDKTLDELMKLAEAMELISDL